MSSQLRQRPEPPVRVGVIGTGRMGSFHAQTVAWRLPDAQLVAVADAADGAARALADSLGVEKACADAGDLLADPDIEAVVIATPARTHAELVVAAAAAGKGVFCEKPMAITLADADRAVAAAEDAGVVLQVGFNRRFGGDFAAAHAVVADGGIGTVQLLRSLTRDPGLANPDRVPPWTIFLETLIHDFDVLRFLNPGARAVEVFATADALVAPEFKDRGLLDTAVVTIRFDNGAIATAEANFSAAYGYDVRAEVFGSTGMVTAGDVRANTMAHYSRAGITLATARRDTDLFLGAYTAELATFVNAVRTGTPPQVNGHDAREALAIALACIESVTLNTPVAVDNRAVAAGRTQNGPS